MIIGEFFALSLAVAITFLTLVFVFANNRRRYDIIDVAWGIVFVLIALATYAYSGNDTLLSVQSLATLLVVCWGGRLAFHLYRRWRKSNGDKRYADLIEQYQSSLGGVAFTMYWRIFIIQAILATVVSSSVIIINASPAVAIGWLAIIGAILWCIGFFFESVGDAQLRRHLAQPENKGKLMTSGLWRYTRHPNYFGEALQWWSIWIIALSVPFGWASAIAPLTITVLLVFISGVRLTEKQFESREGWDAYKSRTSVFFPLPPKK